MRAVIIDDEKDLRFLIRDLLEKHFSESVEIVGEAEDIEDGLALLSTARPDLVFLDVRLKKGTGFDILEQLPEKEFEVIFITAYDKFALKAIQFSAFGYLLKPVQLEQLSPVLERAIARFEEKKGGSGSRLKVLIDNYKNEDKVKRLVVSNVSGFEVLILDEIIRLESENNYTRFWLQEGKKITASRTIKDYEELLDAHGFYRTHQRHIINLRYVKTYQKGDGGSIILTDGSEVPLSRARKAGFLRRFL